MRLPSRPSTVVVLAVLGALALGVAPPLRACSTFCLRTEQGPFLGKNYDWHLGDGMLILNPRGLERVAAVAEHERAARWFARFGSVTFNQYGRDFPMGGINEAGLAIELMWLAGTRYPEADERPVVGVLQWIQRQLDTAATVGEVLAGDADLRIVGGTPLHYLVVDATGAAATVEFLEGRPVVHTGDTLPVPALTNSPYRPSLHYAQSLQRQGRAAPSGSGSMERFARAASRTAEFPGGDREAAFRHAFATLDSVAQGTATRWSIVYDLRAREVRFRTGEDRGVRRLALSDLDFSCALPARMLLLQEGGAGDVHDHLVPYSAAVNRELIGRAFAGTPFLEDTPAAVLDRRARVPEQAVCRP